MAKKEKSAEKRQGQGGEVSPRRGENEFSAGAKVIYSAKSDLMTGMSSNRGKGGK